MRWTPGPAVPKFLIRRSETRIDLGNLIPFCYSIVSSLYYSTFISDLLLSLTLVSSWFNVRYVRVSLQMDSLRLSVQ